MRVLLVAGYGQESASRVARQQIPHQIYKDNNGVEHVRVRWGIGHNLV
jgi:import inner membrane translocase subunit TIM21